MALPRSTQDYKYCFYILIRTILSLLLTFGLYEFVYLKFFLDTSLTELGFLKYLYKIFINQRYDLITFWITSITLLVFIVLLMYFLLKNPHSLTLKFSRYATRST
jgi:sterol desaturase/sphingolipid hydroxylase (fatty acid hydroxylase superfamily)